MRMPTVSPTVASKVLWLTLRVFKGLALLAIAVMAGLAFAQPMTLMPQLPAPAPTGINWESVVSIVLKVFGLIVTAVLLPKLHALLAAHEADKNASASDTALWTLLDKVEHFVEVGLAGVAPKLQADLADGKSAATVAADAAESAKTYLGSAGLAELGDVLGLGGQALTAYLQDLAQKKVAAARVAGAAAAQAIQTGADAAKAINGGA